MKHRTTPIPETITPVPGYPSTLTLFKIPASSYWQVRAFVAATMVKRSTKQSAMGPATVFAKDFYNELLLKASQGKPLTEGSDFEATAKALLKEDQSRVRRGECKQSVVDDAKYLLEKDMYTFFKNDRCKGINYVRINEYLDSLKSRNLSGQTLKQHLNVLHKILKHATKLQTITQMPTFPTIQIKDNPRDWFNEEQYAKLLKTINKAITDCVKVRFLPITEHLRDLTNFTLATFLRPQDIKVLRNKDITAVRKPTHQYLRIMARGKVDPGVMTSLESAVTIYERLQGEPEDFVFFPQYPNRDYAMATMSRQFKYVLEKAGLKTGDNGKERTLYSLRHTAIMNQLLAGMSSAKVGAHSRTSSVMIDRFYGSHLKAEMSVHELHQGNSGSDTHVDIEELDIWK